jgi:hypothetical protein
MYSLQKLGKVSKVQLTKDSRFELREVSRQIFYMLIYKHTFVEK